MLDEVLEHVFSKKESHPQGRTGLKPCQINLRVYGLRTTVILSWRGIIKHQIRRDGPSVPNNLLVNHLPSPCILTSPALAQSLRCHTQLIKLIERLPKLSGLGIAPTDWSIHDLIDWRGVVPLFPVWKCWCSAVWYTSSQTTLICSLLPLMKKHLKCTPTGCINIPRNINVKLYQPWLHDTNSPCPLLSLLPLFIF